MSSGEFALHNEVQSLYRDHHRWLRDWLRRKLGCSHHAADLAHDTFVRLLGRKERADPVDPRAYLTTIAHGL
ncbi:MAG: RNA polymerase subunit sigma, partial [Delftia sp.]|nr:RNA polymerase subunit sigma [Delftia sp.]